MAVRRKGGLAPLACVLMPARRLCGEAGAVVGHVGQDQREREEEQAEDEKAEEAMTLSGSHSGGPKRDRDPEHEKQERQDRRAENRSEEHAYPFNEDK